MVNVAPAALEREAGGELEVIDAIERGGGGLGVDAAAEEFVAEHGAAAGRDAFAVFHPGAGESGVVEEAGIAEALYLVVDGWWVEAAERQPGAHFVFTAWPGIKEAQGGFVGIDAALLAVELVEEVGIGDHALDEAASLAGFFRENELLPIAEGDDARAPASGGGEADNGRRCGTG